MDRGDKSELKHVSASCERYVRYKHQPPADQH